MFFGRSMLTTQRLLSMPKILPERGVKSQVLRARTWENWIVLEVHQFGTSMSASLKSPLQRLEGQDYFPLFPVGPSTASRSGHWSLISR